MPDQAKKLPESVHIIGICGVATSALAMAFHKKGVRVTGSDKGFFPPVSTELQKHGISFYAGWHPENIARNRPEMIVIGGGGSSSSNPEVVYAGKNNIPILSFAEALGKYVVKNKSIVIAGTWGKTTISSLLSFILLKAGMDPSYFTGGLSLSHDAGAISDSDWSVVEGDEYQVSISNKSPKFFYYNPTHLLLTSVSWDHADLYTTEKSYFEIFRELIARIPNDGRIVACIDDPGVNKIIKETERSSVLYGQNDKAHYRYHSVTHTKDGLSFSIDYRGLSADRQGRTSVIRSPILGIFNAENITGSFAMAEDIGIPVPVIIQAIQDFKGIRRRLEKRFEGDMTVLDCHAPTPDKVVSVLHSIREVYDKKIIAIFEPNIGGRQNETITKYDDAFKNADIVIIPHLTKLKISEDTKKESLDGEQLTKVISQTHKDSFFIEDDAKLVDFVIANAKKGDCVVFLGSHGFRGMIEDVIKKLSLSRN